MSSETLRLAAKGIRDEWAEGEPHIKPVAFMRAVADWLASEIPNASHRERQQRDMEAGRIRKEPFPVYYDATTTKAIAVARAYLGSDS